MSNYRDEIFLRKVGKRLKELRVNKNLSQEGLACLCEISPGKYLPTSQIGRMERGEVNASLSYLPLLANILGVTPIDLITFEKD